MRLLLSFCTALLIALLLFALMRLLVMPPEQNNLDEEELVKISFVRSVSDTPSHSNDPARELPPPPEPPTLPTAPQPPSPVMPTLTTQPLSIAVPAIPTSITISSAATPLQTLTASAEQVSLGQPAERSEGLDEEVTPLVDIPPTYPPNALRSGQEGQVTLAFTITAEGRVENLRVIASDPPRVFDREARRAVARWRFTPRQVNGQPVAREATKTLHFRIEGRR
ncbi:MAG: energy transducer TonB [Gammaproteobacteria bacterium HGW-Gammaproteobacteria-11]|nr:MAG: energy transducer TonB [Gammaproteobacteria bacterium HGW-Gammaproteobacteria-11]